VAGAKASVTFCLMNPRGTQIVVTKRIVNLKTNPLQELYTGTFSTADETSLRTDLATNGQRDPVKLLPDGTIRDGHQRVRLLQQLGHEAVQAIVVEPAEDAHAERAAFLRENFSRRQLTALQRGRLAIRVWEAEHGLGVGDAQQLRYWHDLKPVIADVVRGTDRHRIRVLRILLLPDPVINAVDAGIVKMTDAEKLDKLSADGLNALAEAVVDAGDDRDAIRNAVRDAIPITNRPPRKQAITNRLDAIIKATEVFNDHHAEHIRGMSPSGWRAYVEPPKNSKSTIDALLARLTGDADDDALADVVVDVKGVSDG
jgi:ParB-like chromosome segregation protein Spo0J